MGGIANRYWIGNGGNWSDTAHWSTASGGTGGASVPTSADNVYFDANSFTTTGQKVTVDVAANCLDMDWTGATNTPTLAGSSSFNIYGVAILKNGMGLTFTGGWLFQGNGVQGLSTNGVGLLSRITKYGENIFNIDGAIQSSNYFYFNNGIVNTNNNDLTFSYVNIAGTTAKTINLGNSTITLNSSYGWNSITTTNLTFNAGTSTIKLTSDTTTFTGGDLTYHNLELQGNNCTITGSNTFNDLKVKAGNTAVMTAGTTQTLISLVADGATLQSSSAGSAATLSCASGTVEVLGATIQDITATGGATFNAINSTNVSGNTGWNFLSALRGFLRCMSKMW